MHNIKNNHAINRGEEGGVSTGPHVHARLDMRSTLTNEDITRKHNLASIFLHAQTLGIAIPTVAAGTATFFMSHSGPLLLLYNFFDSKTGIVLTVTSLLANAFLGLVMEVVCLFALE